MQRRNPSSPAAHVPVGQCQKGPAQHAASPVNVPPHRESAADLGRDFRALVGWAVAQRKRAIFFGWSRIDHATAKRALDQFDQWLSTNLNPSPATLRHFWQSHQHALRFIMPPNGRRHLDTMERIISMLP